MNHDVECRGCGEDMRLDPNHNEKRCVTNKRVTMNTLERVARAIGKDTLNNTQTKLQARLAIDEHLACLLEELEVDEYLGEPTKTLFIEWLKALKNGS